MTFEEWLAYGMENNYCSAQFCHTHDSGPMHESEERAWGAFDDPCFFVVRLGSYDDWNIDV